MGAVDDSIRGGIPMESLSPIRKIIDKAKMSVRTAANRAGLSVNRQVPVDRQADLIQALRPWITEHPLIRLGGEHDGGYLLPDDLDGIVACFSPGVSDEASF